MDCLPSIVANLLPPSHGQQNKYRNKYRNFPMENVSIEKIDFKNLIPLNKISNKRYNREIKYFNQSENCSYVNDIFL